MKTTRYRVLRGLNYIDPKGKPDANGVRPYKRAEVGTVIDDAPAHGTGKCGASCQRPGSHTWMLEDDAVLEPMGGE